VFSPGGGVIEPEYPRVGVLDRSQELASFSHGQRGVDPSTGVGVKSPAKSNDLAVLALQRGIEVLFLTLESESEYTGIGVLDKEAGCIRLYPSPGVGVRFLQKSPDLVVAAFQRG